MRIIAIDGEKVTDADRVKHKAAHMKKQTFWIGSMEFQGYLLHVVSATKASAEQALLREYKKQKERDLKNPTFAELKDYLGVWVQEAKLDKVVRP